MKVCFLLSDKGIYDIDMRYPEKGNPGIGGTQYCFIMLSRYLTKLYSGEINVEICHFNRNLLPCDSDTIIQREEDVIDYVNNSCVDILIVQNGQNEEWYNTLARSKVKCIVWAHNYPNFKEARILADTSNVVRVVCVGRQEYDRYVDHDVINKMVWIYNMFYVDRNLYYRSASYSPRVTYTGSLIPSKGFHILAKYWKDILSEFPNAKLSVIGSGKLYNRQNYLGTGYGIADKEYENEFMPYLTDANGEILKSVHFHGIVGQEKNQIYQDTAVGIINPSAITETFGLSAVEMEACGIPIVSRRYYGLVDTIKHKATGYLFKNEKDFPHYIVKLLKNRELNHQLGSNGIEFVESKFDPEKLTKKWYDLFVEVCEGRPVKYVHPSDYWMNDYKWARVLNRNLHKIIKTPSIIDIKHL